MEELLRVSKALSDPIRLEILTILAGPATCCPDVLDPHVVCVCEFVERLGLKQSKVSYHLRELKEAGLIVEEPRGRWNYYRMNKTALERYIGRLRSRFRL